MGSGGMSSGLGRGSIQQRLQAASQQIQSQQPISQQQQQQNIQNQTPNPQNTTVTPQALKNLSQMSDSQLAALAKQAKKAVMPNNISDRPDATQNFVYTAGLNEKPVVLDDNSFKQFMKDNGMTNADLLARSVSAISFNVNGVQFNYSANDVIDMMKYSRLNYIGGKVGGQAYGAGTYFDHTGGRSTGYGGSNAATAVAVLNPKTVRAITLSSLQTKARQFAMSHPQFTQEVGYPSSGRGGNISIYALAMGYNVITESSRGKGFGGLGDYVNVIDRSALVYRQSNG